MEEEVGSTIGAATGTADTTLPQAESESEKGSQAKKRKTPPAESTEKSTKRPATTSKKIAAKAKAGPKLNSGFDGTEDLMPLKRQTRGKVLNFNFQDTSDESDALSNDDNDSDGDYDSFENEVKCESDAELKSTSKDCNKTRRITSLVKSQPPCVDEPASATAPLILKNINFDKIQELNIPKKQVTPVQARKTVQAPATIKMTSLQLCDQPFPSIERSPSPSITPMYFDVSSSLSSEQSAYNSPSNIEITALRPGTILSFAPGHKSLVKEGSFPPAESYSSLPSTTAHLDMPDLQLYPREYTNDLCSEDSVSVASNNNMVATQPPVLTGERPS